MTNNEHITERELDLFVASPEQLPEQEREQLQTHLSHCKLCSEHWQAVEAFYSELEAKLDQPPSKQDEQLAEELLRPEARKLLPSDALIKAYAEAIEPIRQTLAQRVFEFVQLHPVRTAGTATLIAAALVAVFLLIQPVKSADPSYAAIKDHTLYVYNKNKDFLWKKDALGIPDVEINSIARDPATRKLIFLIEDIDDDSQNEVLVSGLSNEKGQSFTLDSLYCFNSSGNLRWVQAYPSNAFAESFDYTRSGRWNIRHFLVMKQTEASKPRLFVLAYCGPYFPAKISEVSTADGAELRTYWHPGGISTALAHDIDSDGIQEIIAIGPNNGYGRGYMLALNPDHLEGCGPAPPEFYPAGIPRAKEKYYMLFPRTDIGEKYSKVPYNSANDIQVSHNGNLIVYVNELIDQSDAKVLYTIGSNFSVLSATWDDPFLKKYDQLLSEGKVKRPLTPEYWENLKRGALYWDGGKSRFVKYEELKKSGMPRVP